MKRLFALSLPLLLSATAFCGPFTMGDLVVVTVGDGSSVLTSTAMSGALYEYNTTTANQAGPLNTVALPMTLSGSASSEGFIALSTDGRYLTLAGYNAAVGAAVLTVPASTVNRVVARVDMNGNFNTTTLLGDAYNSGNIRSAVSTDGSSFWTTGTASSGGASRYTTLGSTTSVQLNATPTNVRVANLYNGQLYISSASGFGGVAAVGSGTPTTSGQTVTELPGMPTSGTGHSPYDFWFKDANTLYVADDGGTVASGGGIQKWTLSAGTWSLAYNLLNDGSTVELGTRGLAGSVDGSGNTHLYATTTIAFPATTGNQLIEVDDTGAYTGAYTVLATAPAGDAFRGVELVPEPSGLALAGLGLLALAVYRRVRR